MSLAPIWKPRYAIFKHPSPIAIAIVLTIRYLYWRVTETVPPTDQLDDVIAGIIFLAIELLAIGGMVL